MFTLRQQMKSMDISSYIEENIFHSESWDRAEEVKRNKAVKQSERTLKRILPKIYSESIPLEHLAEQVVWLMKIDDMFQRAEMGASYITVDGISLNITDKDRTLAPFILQVNNITPDSLTGGISKRKVARYGTSLSDSFRKGW